MYDQADEPMVRMVIRIADYRHRQDPDLVPPGGSVSRYLWTLLWCVVGLAVYATFIALAQAFGPRLIIIGLLGLAAGVWIMWVLESTKPKR